MRATIGPMLSLPGPLVSVDWLAANLTDPGLRIADVRWSLAGPPGRERYAGGHVPGAVFLDAERELSSPGEGPGRHPVPSAAKLAAVLGRSGIGDDHVVVAYDDAGGSIAARLWWLYRHFGHDGACAVLDGGIAAWTDAGNALTTDAPDHPAATWTPGDARRRPGRHRRGRRDARRATPSCSTRGRPSATGARPSRSIRVPGTSRVPSARRSSSNLGPDGRFLAPEALRARYASLGADERPVVAYCGSSLSATHDLLALELAGIDGGRLYEGSWSHWSSDPSRPAATGPTP